MLAFIRWTLLWLWFAASCSLWTIYLFFFRTKDFSAHRLTQSVCKPALKILGIDLKIENKDRLSRYQPCVYIANHQDLLDVFTFGSFFPANSFVVAKKSLKYVPFFGWVFTLSNNVYIDRKNKQSAREKFAIAETEINERGRSFFVFPEGTRSRGKGLGAFKKGAFHVALNTNRPIVPIIAKNYQLNYNSFSTKQVNIKVLEPIYIDPNKDLNQQIKSIHSKISQYQNS